MDGGEFENGVAEKNEAPSTPPPEPRLTREEQLTLENLYLKVENLKLQRERIIADYAKSGQMLQQLQREAEAYAVELKKKYGDDLPGAVIRPDGTVGPSEGAGR
jgi:hypothetical protein